MAVVAGSLANWWLGVAGTASPGNFQDFPTEVNTPFIPSATKSSRKIAIPEFWRDLFAQQSVYEYSIE